jgi:predicted nucleic-acid-binding protein
MIGLGTLVLGAILRTAQFQVQESDLAFRALGRFEAGAADFADYLLAEQATRAGCDACATFDRKLLREEGFFRP